MWQSRKLQKASFLRETPKIYSRSVLQGLSTAVFEFDLEESLCVPGQTQYSPEAAGILG